MMYPQLIAGCLVAASCGALQGCRVGADDLEPALANRLDRVETRLQALEFPPQLDFTVHNEQILVEEKTFTPLLVAQAELAVTGESLPPALYVEVLLAVSVNETGYAAEERQIFPVVEGRCQVLMQHSLPQHGLSREQMTITLRPMAWYRGQAISDESVSYQRGAGETSGEIVQTDAVTAAVTTSATMTPETAQQTTQSIAPPAPQQP